MDNSFAINNVASQLNELNKKMDELIAAINNLKNQD